MPKQADINILLSETREVMARIGKERDRLRELEAEVSEYAEDADMALHELTDAKHSLSEAADTLSKYV